MKKEKIGHGVRLNRITRTGDSSDGFTPLLSISSRSSLSEFSNFSLYLPLFCRGNGFLMEWSLIKLILFERRRKNRRETGSGISRHSVEWGSRAEGKFLSSHFPFLTLLGLLNLFGFSASFRESSLFPFGDTSDRQCWKNASLIAPADRNWEGTVLIHGLIKPVRKSRLCRLFTPYETKLIMQAHFALGFHLRQNLPSILLNWYWTEIWA